jgi:hypothetical protein
MQKQGIELFSAFAYYGRLLFVIHLLSFLNASTNHPQMVNLGRAGPAAIETANLTPR